MQSVLQMTLAEFIKIPLVKKVFTPFAQVQLIKKQLIQNKKQKFIYKQDKTQKKIQKDLQDYSDTQMEMILNSKGECEYIYIWNTRFLEIMGSHKLGKIRIILQSQISQIKMQNQQGNPNLNILEDEQKYLHIQIRNKLLIIVYERHIYVQDLISNNNQLTPDILPQSIPHESSISIMSTTKNQHHICHISKLPSRYPNIKVQLYSIEKSKDLKVTKKYDKIFRIFSQSGEIEKLYASKNNNQFQKNQVLFCAVVKRSIEEQIRRVVIVGVFQVKNTINEKQTSEDSLSVQMKIYYADMEMISRFSNIFTPKRENRIASSWIIPGQGKSRLSSFLQNNKFTQSQPILISTPQYFIISKKNQLQIILINRQKQQDYNQTSFIYHTANILQVIKCNLNSIYILDQNRQIWKYSFQSIGIEEVVGNILQRHNIQKIMQILITNNFEKNKKSNISELKIFTSSNNRLGIIENNAFLYLVYSQFFMPEIDFQSLKGIPKCTQKNSSFPTFLSVQTEDLSQNMIEKQNYYQTLLIPYMTITTTQPTFNILSHLLLHTFPILQIQFSSISVIHCTFQTHSILSYIFQQISKLKSYLLGAVQNSPYNKYYFLLSDLYNHRLYSKDIVYIINEIISQLDQSKHLSSIRIFEIVLNWHKLKQWLIDKNTHQVYKIICMNNYLQCRLMSTCSCVLKRVIFYFISNDVQEKANKLTKKFNLVEYLKYEGMYKQLFYFFDQNNKEKDNTLQLMLKQKEQAIKKKIEAQKRHKIIQMNKKWSQHFSPWQKTIQKSAKFELTQQTAIKNTSPFCQNNKISRLTITYLQSKQYQNILLANYTKQNNFIQEILALQYKFKNNDKKCGSSSEIGANFKKLYELCKQNNLFKIDQSAINTIPKQKSQNVMKNNKYENNIIAIGVIYRIYTYLSNLSSQKLGTSTKQQPYQSSQQRYNKSYNQKPQSSFKSQNNYQISNNSLNLTTFFQQQSQFRKYWLLLYKIFSVGLITKYDCFKQIAETFAIINKTIQELKLKYLLALINILKKIETVLQFQEYYCLIEIVIKLQIYRFDSQFSCHRLKLSQLRFQYSNSIWEKGISKIYTIYQQKQQKYQNIQKDTKTGKNLYVKANKINCQIV